MIFNLKQWLTRKEPPKTLAERCAAYLRNGPPAEMTNYVPGSLTEGIIAQGASGRPLDAEFREMASLILHELADLNRFEDPKVRAYMAEGAGLVGEIVRRP